MADAEQHERPEYVTLISNDGFEFLLQTRTAIRFDRIRRMLDPNSMPALLFSLALLRADYPN
jgi:hypothetical protein